jgi:hypothetical protein
MHMDFVTADRKECVGVTNCNFADRRRVGDAKAILRGYLKRPL